MKGGRKKKRKKNEDKFKFKETWKGVMGCCTIKKEKKFLFIYGERGRKNEDRFKIKKDGERSDGRLHC